MMINCVHVRGEPEVSPGVVPQVPSPLSVCCLVLGAFVSSCCCCFGFWRQGLPETPSGLELD